MPSDLLSTRPVGFSQMDADAQSGMMLFHCICMGERPNTVASMLLCVSITFIHARTGRFTTIATSNWAERAAAEAAAGDFSNEMVHVCENTNAAKMPWYSAYEALQPNGGMLWPKSGRIYCNTTAATATTIPYKYSALSVHRVLLGSVWRSLHQGPLWRSMLRTMHACVCAYFVCEYGRPAHSRDFFYAQLFALEWVSKNNDFRWS